MIFVGIVPSAAQKLQLQDYSRKFNVREWERQEAVLEHTVHLQQGVYQAVRLRPVVYTVSSWLLLYAASRSAYATVAGCS